MSEPTVGYRYADAQGDWWMLAVDGHWWRVEPSEWLSPRQPLERVEVRDE